MLAWCRRDSLNIALVLGAAMHAGAYAADVSGRVVSVHDGDTLTVLVDRVQIRVRLDSIDAPELGQAFGQRSRESLASLCAGVSASVQQIDRDRYGRTVGRVACRGKDASTEQVRTGMAWIYVKYARRDDPLHGIELEARAARIGLWSNETPVPPWDWRRTNSR